MRLRASRGRFLDLAIRVTALVTVACTSLDGLTGKDPDTRDDGTLPDRSKGPGNADTLEPEPGPGGDPPAAERAERFCETNTATFCADFEADLMTGWSSRAGTHGDTLHLDNAFVAVTEAVAAGFVPRAYLRKDIRAEEHEGKNDVRYTFSVRIDQLGATPTKGGTLAAIAFGTGAYVTELLLNVFADGRTVLAARSQTGEGDAGSTAMAYKEHPLPAFAAGAWRRVEIRVDRAGQAVAVSIDGAEGLAPTPTRAPLPAGPLTVFAGVSYADPPAAAWTVRYDDIAVDVR